MTNLATIRGLFTYSALILIALAMAGLPSYGDDKAKPGAIITFDVLGATGFTEPNGINAAGEIAGTYAVQGDDYAHGFLRSRDGVITKVDPPGALGITSPSLALNDQGEVTGLYTTPDFRDHAFLRSRNGAMTEFAVPGAGVTIPVGINNRGDVTGWYFDMNFVVVHSFLRTRDGAITTFDPAMANSFGGNINPAGAVVGYSLHGFVRDPKGAVTIFDAPNVCATYASTFAYGINAGGVVVGTYNDATCSKFHGFLRAPDGKFTTVDFPGADATGIYAINQSGTVTGNIAYFQTKTNPCFVRTPAGAFTTFLDQCFPAAINASGDVTGFFQAGGVKHGFVRLSGNRENDK